METLRDKIGRWLPFAFWVLMTIIAVITLIVCIYLVAKKIAVVWSIISMIGSLVSIVVFAIQSWGEWIEAKMPSV